MPDLHWVAYVGIILGVLARTYLPYYVKKLRADEQITLKFERKYVIAAIAAVIAAATTAQPLLVDFVLPATATNPWLAFVAALVYAGIWNTLVNAFYLDYKAPAPT